MKFFLLFLVSWNCFSQGVTILKTVEQAAQFRLRLADMAKKEIFVSYFIFDDDRIGLSGLTHLLVKKEKNPSLDIRVLFDGSANGVDRRVLAYLQNKGIQFKEFNPTPKINPGKGNWGIKRAAKALANLNMRMHDKIFLVDATHLITGGRNVKKGYYGLNTGSTGNGKRNFHDRDIYSSSTKAGEEARAYYLALWDSKYTSEISLKQSHSSEASLKNAEIQINAARKRLESGELFNISKRNNLVLEEFSVPDDKVTFLNSYNGSDFVPEYLSDQLIALTEGIKSIYIETPYLLPTERFFNVLERLKGKAKVSVITNSICSTDVMMVAAAYDVKKKQILENDVHLYEYKGGKGKNFYLHSKSAVINDNISLVGTYNMDPRSAKTNTEVILMVDDVKVAKALKGELDIDKNGSSKVSLKDGKIFGEYTDCHKTMGQKIKYSFFKDLAKNDKMFYDML